MAYEQAGSSLTLFADRYTNLHIAGATVPSSWFQSEQPLFVLLFAPLFAVLWQALGARGWEPATALKMAIGLACVGIGYLFMVAGGHTVDACLATHGAGACAIASPWSLTNFYLLSVLGELCLSPVGLSYVTKLAPPRHASVLMGAWFLATAMGEKLAGSLAALTARVPSQATFFAIPLLAALAAALVLVALLPTLRRLTAGAT
jgi:POT family proton-dependent oligopeptide transporter